MGFEALGSASHIRALSGIVHIGRARVSGSAPLFRFLYWRPRVPAYRGKAREWLQPPRPRFDPPGPVFCAPAACNVPIILGVLARFCPSKSVPLVQDHPNHCTPGVCVLRSSPLGGASGCRRKETYACMRTRSGRSMSIAKRVEETVSKMETWYDDPGRQEVARTWLHFVFRHTVP